MVTKKQFIHGNYIVIHVNWKAFQGKGMQFISK